MTFKKNLQFVGALLLLGSHVFAVDLQRSVLNSFNNDIQVVSNSMTSQMNEIKKIGANWNTILASVTSYGKSNANTALLAALPAVRTTVNTLYTAWTTNYQSVVTLLNAALAQIQTNLVTQTTALALQRDIFLSSVNASTVAGGNPRLCAQNYYDSFEKQEMTVYTTMGNTASAAFGSLATIFSQTGLQIRMVDNVVTNHLENFKSPYWTVADASLYFNKAIVRVQQASTAQAVKNQQAANSTMQALGLGIVPPVSTLLVPLRTLMNSYALCSRMVWPAGK